MSAPVVRLVDGLLVVEHTNPRPASFEISSELFDLIVDELNAHRRNVLRATDVLTSIVGVGRSSTAAQ